MIVGTAGHIDHGKTALVRALTGVDTDRLPEEKRRGISIELGYAYLDVPGGPAGERIAFVDVPGHERLVRTMLAGATGIDFCLLLIAADDGVMPQTREHLAIFSLLGLARGLVVVTKNDRVPTARVAEVRAQAVALLVGTPLAGAEVLEVSSLTGAGIDALRERLFDAARATAQREDPGLEFRLAVDRVFTLDGVGTVATGTVHAGRVTVGDELEKAPSGTAANARVRSLHAQNRPVQSARAGERCAVAVAGIAHDALVRGQWLVARGCGISTRRLDVLLTLWHDEEKPLRSGTPVHVHVGSADVLGTVAILRLLDQPAASELDVPLGPGASAWVQLVLRTPIAAWHGDRVVLRDNAAARTLAGGRVLDPFAPVRHRRTPQRFDELAAWSREDAASRLEGLIAASPDGVSVRHWALAEGLLPDRVPPLTEGGVQIHDAASGDWVVGAGHAAAVRRNVLETLAAFHAREPDALGPDAARLRRLAAPRLPDALWRGMLSTLREAGAVVLRGAFVHLPEHALKLSASDERIAQKILPLMSEAGFEGSWVRDLAKDLHEQEAALRTTLARLAQSGSLHQVVRDLYFTQDCVARLAGLARGLAGDAEGTLSAARFRDATGLGRKRAIQVLEYFDRIGLLRRVGDLHRVRSDTTLFEQGTP
ncbi:selenocysteine-specific translation elongation factor [Variovorax sp. Sphag1AA]|uniref:selenocysteine-specific translation elongation factor n=1 Tax=Variovorax sp. Sphag1AA TaxID=2587027 RepID=UPI00161624D4|nr:selenocysteine-specific translation elongation factor [Variovorax sp. Sphag1AA]MBB3181387.1 selenocysteine-specific elongation factor [Variovorax sp. Sphag1AA]